MNKSPLIDLFDFFISKFKVKKTRKRVGIFIIYEEYNLTSGYLKLFTTLKLIFNEYVGEILAGAKINTSAATAARYKSPQKANTETIYLLQRKNLILAHPPLYWKINMNFGLPFYNILITNWDISLIFLFIFVTTPLSALSLIIISNSNCREEAVL